MATIKDVANKAGVSISTVSHVLNNTRFVAETTKERVFQAIKELNYAPSAVARSLKVNRTRTLGMLVTTSTNPYFAEVIRGVEETCAERGYTLILCNSGGDPDRQQASLRMLIEKRVDGILVMLSEDATELYGLLGTHPELPQVLMEWGDTQGDIYRIQDNAEQGGYLAAKHLIDKGHKAIGCITGPASKSLTVERLAGYRRAMGEAGLEVNPAWILEGDFEPEGGYAAMERLLAQKDRPTALFVFSDPMALGAISAAHMAGLRVPQDLSVIGYDDVPMANFFSPPLTTIHQPKYRLGQKAAKILLAKVNKEEESNKVLTLHPELIERSSVLDLA
ncbi:substrate-binding domain-containing protein [Gallaecimonas xiamenensis]|uniref:Transcriptional regulator, LacI family protein n=1 Tax=Gallaecimonas xiamenensis 3-C-1 TaxID=745411 RepID=K2K3F1_9GAMM|nr:substrate-binding domain-containing protein [Gallaecimonas xiamenensis]EKE77479.1 transcriptional regulator, LacI family protein [Gallaecimonas xiamenensis 3-C-1]